MVQVVALVLFVTAIALWWRHVAGQKKLAGQKKHPAAPAAKRDMRTSYHCVEVRTGVPACESAQHLEHVRYLSEEAPILPVPGCSMKKCTCSYIHHDDRRDDDERRNPCGQWSNMPPAITGERRSRTERRQSRENMFRPLIVR